MAESNSVLKRTSTLGGTDTDLSKKILIPVRVVDIILDIYHPMANKLGGYDAIGTIFYAEVYNKEGADFPHNLRTAKPMFQFIKQYPLKNEIVSIIVSPGTDLYGKKGKADTRTSTYYFPNFNVWNHNNHNALPDMRYYQENENQKNDYELVGEGVVRTAKDGSTEIDFGDYFKENLNLQPLLPFEGDTILEGRFGNSIRFGATTSGSREQNAYSTTKNSVGDPITIIRNGQLVEEEDKGWEHTLENVNTDHSSVYLCSNQKFPNLEIASPNWETWLVGASDLTLQNKDREYYDNITKGIDPAKIVTPETDDSNEGGSGNFDLGDYVEEPAEALVLPAGMCYNPCGDDELSIYDQLIAQENFDYDEFDGFEEFDMHMADEEIIPREEVDAIESGAGTADCKKDKFSNATFAAWAGADGKGGGETTAKDTIVDTHHPFEFRKTLSYTSAKEYYIPKPIARSKYTVVRADELTDIGNKHTAGKDTRIVGMAIHCTAGRQKTDGFGSIFRHVGKKSFNDDGVWDCDRPWPTGGYNWMIVKNGHLQQNYPDTVTAMGIGNAAKKGKKTGTVLKNANTVQANWLGAAKDPGGGWCNKYKMDMKKEQAISLKWLCKLYIKRYPNILIFGHNQVAGKACPNFDVRTWLTEIGAPSKNIWNDNKSGLGKYGEGCYVENAKKVVALSGNW